MKYHAQTMVQKIAVTLDPNTVAELDRWVREGRYPNRSGALESAVDYFAKRDKRNRLVRELNKLDRAEESRLAEEGLGDQSWPTY
jgi:Arc/MetJ-type ribon-helix-helix transcriptional regulator